MSLIPILQSRLDGSLRAITGLREGIDAVLIDDDFEAWKKESGQASVAVA